MKMRRRPTMGGRQEMRKDSWTIMKMVEKSLPDIGHQKIKTTWGNRNYSVK
jgi:hypothetical protein